MNDSWRKGLIGYSWCINITFFAASKTTRLSSPASTPSDVVDLIITAAPTSCKRAMLPMITWIPVVEQLPIQTNSAHFPERPLSKKDSLTVSAFSLCKKSYFRFGHRILLLSCSYILLDYLAPDEYYYFSWPEICMTFFKVIAML